MLGNILAGHGEKQIKDISFEESSASSMFFCKGNLDLSKGVAVLAVDTRDFEDDGGMFSSEGQGAEAAFFGALVPNVSRFATGTGKLCRTDGKEKLDAAGHDLLTQEGIAANAVHGIQ